MAARCVLREPRPSTPGSAAPTTPRCRSTEVHAFRGTLTMTLPSRRANLPMSARCASRSRASPRVRVSWNCRRRDHRRAGPVDAEPGRADGHRVACAASGADIPCAIKLIDGEASRSLDTRARFEREAQSAAQSQPACRHDPRSRRTGSIPYIATEYLDGEDLVNATRSRGATRCCQHLSYRRPHRPCPHQGARGGIVHRDQARKCVPRWDDDNETPRSSNFSGIGEA